MCLQIMLYTNQTLVSVCMFVYGCMVDKMCRKVSRQRTFTLAGQRPFLLQENKSPTTEHVSQNRIEKLQLKLHRWLINAAKYVKQLQVQIFGFQVLRGTEPVPTAVIINRPRVC